ncbi:ATP-binding protein [Spiribacter sp. SSL99]|uniref:sensor histidine kinase n=1 Tax=Spiribacter sp. SSL99 TaxID=1866884 RepID=UPI001330EA8D|nr:ATP-binding protein [Spiribacter sp. SSL99]
MTAESRSNDVSAGVIAPFRRLDDGVIGVMVVLAIMLMPVAALADDPAIDPTEYLITKAPAIPGERADWQPYQIGQTLGFVEGSVWMRLGFAAPGAMPDNPWLLIRPVHLDHITIYRDTATPTPRLIAGDRQPTAGGIVPSTYALALTDADIAEGLLIRFNSHNLMQPHLKVRSQTALQGEGTAFYLLISIAIAATLFYLLWAATAMIASPTPLVAAFIARLSLYLLTLLIHTGLTRPFFGEGAILTQDLAHNATALTYITVAQVFDLMLLREIGGRWATRLFAGVIAVSALSKLLAFGLGAVPLALQINNASALATLVLALVLTPFCRPSGRAVYVINRGTLAIYFLLQAFPLALLFAGTLIESAWFARLLEFSFINYAVLPGAYIAWILFRRQQVIIRQRNTLAERSRLLQARSKEQSLRRKEMGELLEMLSHEVRTPLATLRLAHHMDALDGATVGRATQAIDHALRQADRVEELERGRLQVRPQPLELGALVDALGEERGVHLEREGQPTIVQADPELLRVVLSNLISNAGKYGLPPHPVMVSIEQSAEVVTLRLSNRVERGTEPDSSRAFEKYYRAERASGQSGTGLGLYIVRQLSERMGIDVELVAGDGCVSVILTLPSPASENRRQPEEDHDRHRTG